ncbi:MAG TPA: hypothetical protein VI461_10995 [Chitinophagaceae bacterium]|nr:hypothetical protein [Chitinophagaceae bacterium]
MDKAKIRLSSKEAELVADAEVILTKNIILQKAKLLLEELQLEQQQFLQSNPGLLPAEVMAIPPKISKGENYKGLPYLVLDQPRYFERNNHFAIRSMFWWGNYFTVTLHLSGIYKKKYSDKIETSFTYLKENGFFICTSDDEWEHHIEKNNYRPLNEMSIDEFKTYAGNNKFIKLVKKIPLKQWDDAGDILLTSFCSIIRRLMN